MVIISGSNGGPSRRYGSSQTRYGTVYVLVTLIVLLFLNIYTSKTSQQIFYQNKQSSMIEKALLAAAEIGDLEVMNHATISEAVSQMENLKVTRLLITDNAGVCIYDSTTDSAQLGKYMLLSEVVCALGGRDVFTWRYIDGVMHSQAAAPIMSYGTQVGCIYIMEHDAAQGELIKSLQYNTLSVTLILEFVVILFSFAFSTTFSHRFRKIMTSMKIIQKGDYTHKVNLGGRDELSFLGREFNDLTERLQTSEKKRRQFVSDASHELKTPLASIKLLSDSILQNNMDAETMREFVGDIGNEAERLNRMTQKLLSLTKADGEVVGEVEIIHMAPTVERVAKMLSVIAQENNITIALDLSNDCPVLILEDDLYQVIFNLVENGIKYNIPGGTLTVRLSRDAENAYLQVSDTGMGIPEDAIGHVFERFYRVDKARSRKSGGSGLGLSIVRSIVERYRGEIRVESAVGQGSSFTVILPAFDTEEDSE